MLVAWLAGPGAPGRPPRKRSINARAAVLRTHMGGPLGGTYQGRYKLLGPCPFHLTTFDLAKHGMVELLFACGIFN